MPLLIVPSHHESPKSVKNIFRRDYPLRSPTRKMFLRRGQEWSIGSWIIIPTIEALDKILVSPEHSFEGYSYELEQQTLSIDYDEDDDRNVSERMLDFEDPACQIFWVSSIKWCSGISLIDNNTQYSDCMRALLEIMWDLPIVSVLQAYVFDPSFFDKLSVWSESGIELTQDMLSSSYPHGMLAWPKRIWPEFYHAHTWESILRISHHPDKDNSPHYYAFASDPRLWNIEEGDDLNVIVKKIRNTLMPIIEKEIEKINKAHVRVFREG